MPETEGHIERDLKEFNYRSNRSTYKQIIFGDLIRSMINLKPIDCKYIMISR